MKDRNSEIFFGGLLLHWNIRIVNLALPTNSHGTTKGKGFAGGGFLLDLASSSNKNEGTTSNDPVSENAGSCTSLCCTGGVINQPTNITLECAV